VFAPNGQIQTLTHYFKLPSSKRNEPRMPIKDFWIAILRLKWTTRHLIDSMMMMVMMTMKVVVVAAAIIIIVIMMTMKSYKICSCIRWVTDNRDSDHGDFLHRRYSILLKT